jgi:hypothetical protein
MKNENIDNLFKELVIVGIIFMSICFGLQSIEHNQELERIHKLVEVERTAKIEAMKLAIDINNTLEIHREINLSLNIEIDSLINELNEFKDLEKLKKDLDRSN